MEPTEFIQLVTQGDPRAALTELQRDPALAAARNPHGVSVVCLAVYHRRAELAAALAGMRADLDIFEAVRRGGEVNTPSRNAMRVCPLHSAAAHSDQAKAVELARLVLQAGADPNARQQAGFTALHEAAQNDNLALVALLLQHGADPELDNDNRVRPADLARAKGHAAALRLLESSAKEASR